MKTIVILAATLAALCFVSPAEARLGDRIRKFRAQPAIEFTADEKPAELQKVKEPKQRKQRWGLFKRLRTHRAASGAAVKANRAKRAELRAAR